MSAGSGITLKPIPTMQKPAEKPALSSASLVTTKLAADERRAEALRFFVIRVLNREMSYSELEARLADRVNDYGNLKGPSTDSANTVYIKNKLENYIRPTREERDFARIAAQSALSKTLIEASKILSVPQDQTDYSRRLRAIAYFIERVATGDMRYDELEARLANRVDVYGNLKGPSTDSANTVYIKNKLEDYIKPTRNEEAFGTITAQTPLAYTLLETAKVIFAEPDRTNFSRRIAALKYFTALLLDPNISYAELEARLADRVDVYGTLKGPSTDSANTVYIKNKLEDIIRPTREERSNSQELRRLDLTEDFLFLAKLCDKSQQFPEIAQAAQTYLKDRSDSSKDELYQLLIARQQDESVVDRMVAVLGRSDEILRKSEFCIDYRNLISTSTQLPDPRQIEARINRYEIKDDEDRAFIKQGEQLINSLDFLTQLRGVVEALRNPSNIEIIQKSVAPILESRNETLTAAANCIVEEACKREVENFKAATQAQFGPTITRESIRAFVESLPIRADIGTVQYGAVSTEAEEALSSYFELQDSIKRQIAQLEAAVQFRKDLTPGQFEAALQKVSTFDFGLPDDEAVRQILIRDIEERLPAESRAEFTAMVGNDLSRMREQFESELFRLPKLGRNQEALTSFAELFRARMNPLLVALRDDPESEEAIKTALQTRASVIRLDDLRKQRPLTEIEEAYLESVARLSQANPALMGMLKRYPEEVAEYLRCHFNRLTLNTLEAYPDGSYVPILVIGEGPNGIAAAGEVFRLDPTLANSMLYIDSGEIPGGPFSIPEGPAWGMNSANDRSEKVILPRSPKDIAGNLPGFDERKTVRGWGSPIGRYPGERDKEGENARRGSINTVVGYLGSPDATSSARYPSNEEFSLLMQAQATLIMRNSLMRTRAVAVEPNLDPLKKGDKIVTLQTMLPDGTIKNTRLYTGARWIPSGLGDAGYGFELQGTRAQQEVLSIATPLDRLPLLTTTLEAFRCFSSRRNGVKVVGSTLVIYGSGNSTDTVLEHIGGIFRQSSPIVKNITRVVVIAEKELSLRCRYNLIKDISSRGKKKNIVEFVKARVGDVALAEPDKDGNPRVSFVAKDGQPIRDESGSVITADHGIAATGFRPSILKIFKGMNLDDNSLVPFTLPNAPEIAVAETLKDDPNTLFFGTASRAQFSRRKLLQLPSDARTALLKNGGTGGENAVAVGFRVPDTIAAVRAWLTARDIDCSDAVTQSTLTVSAAPQSEMTAVKTIEVNVGGRDTTALLKIGNIKLERLASAELGYLLKNEKLKVTDTKGGFDAFNLGLDIRMVESTDGRKLQLAVIEGLSSSASKNEVTESQALINGISPEFASVLTRVFSDPYLAETVIAALRSKRRGKTLRANIRISNGEVQMWNTLIY